MRVAQIELQGFRGVSTGRVVLPTHGVLLGPNNVGKTALVEAMALLFGRERIASQLSDWDFFGGLPQPDSRFTIICTITGFSTEDPEEHPNWFSGEHAAQPVWWHEDSSELSFETDCPVGGNLAAQIALAGRYEAEDCEFETKRYFYNGTADPFTDGCETVSARRLEELGVFIIPGNRQWDRLMSFASSSFIKSLRQSDAVPGNEIEKLKKALRDPKLGLEEAVEFSALLATAEKELQQLTLLKSDSALAYRITSLDTAGVLQSLLPHVKDAQGLLLPLNKHGAGMVSLQSFLVVLAIAERRRKAAKNFILVAEEPELHLHPSLHRRLANRIRGVSTQSLLTTHSPVVAAAFKPNESVLVSNISGTLTAQRLRNEPILDIPSNAIRKLYLQKREAFYEAILGAAVVVPEGESDYRWLRHLLRLVEGADTGAASSLPFSVVPTQDGAIVDTFSETVRFNPNTLPLVDGDSEGKEYLKNLADLKVPPKNIAVLGEGAAAEFLAAWVLEPCLQKPSDTLKTLLPNEKERHLKDLQRVLTESDHKKNRELHENLMSEASENVESVARATQFLSDLSAVVNSSVPKNGKWRKLTLRAGVEAYHADHIRKE